MRFFLLGSFGQRGRLKRLGPVKPLGAVGDPRVSSPRGCGSEDSGAPAHHRVQLIVHGPGLFIPGDVENDAETTFMFSQPQ